MSSHIYSRYIFVCTYLCFLLHFSNTKISEYGIQLEERLCPGLDMKECPAMGNTVELVQLFYP